MNKLTELMKGRWTFAMLALGLATILTLSAFTLFDAEQVVHSETMLRSNQLYENGRFQEATQTYQQLVDQGIEHASLYYNLGNAYYKVGDLGNAILNFERASRLAPRDGDIAANLEYAHSLSLDRYEIDAHSPVEDWVGFASSYLTLDELSILVLGLFWLMAALIIAYRHRRYGRLRSLVQTALLVVVLLFGISAFTLGSYLYMENTRPSAILVTESVDILSGPGEDHITEFSLHAGAQVRILETRGQWFRLALPGEQFQGWAPLEVVETIS